MATPTMLGEIVPAEVAVCESVGDPEAAPLYPEEEARIAGAVAKRRLEFGSVRRCARAALRQLGLPPAAILPGQRGAPGWPDGVVGSMTHCDGYRAAAVAHARDVAGIGIDAEVHAPLPDGVRDMVARDEELAMLAELAAAAPRLHWDMVLFSAKESVYKAWFPLTGRWLDFAEASVGIDPSRDAVAHRPGVMARGSFTARLLVPGPTVAGRTLSGFPGRWLVRNGLVLTSVVVPA